MTFGIDLWLLNRAGRRFGNGIKWNGTGKFCGFLFMSKVFVIYCFFSVFKPISLIIFTVFSYQEKGPKLSHSEPVYMTLLSTKSGKLFMRLSVRLHDNIVLA